MQYTSFEITIKNHVATLAINRPEKANSLHETAWEELGQAFEALNEMPEVRVIILKGEGRNFCAGIDLATLMDLQRFQGIDCEGRKREKLRKFIFKLQNAINAIEQCRKPVLAAAHGACVGGGFDIFVACDMRYACDGAYFAIKEIDLGMVADLGILQRLPKIIHAGMAAELAYTGRKLGGEEAQAIGLTNRNYATPEMMLEEVTKIAESIAEKSPISIRGTKEMLLYARDHSVADSLNYMTAWNASMLITNDLMEAFSASMSKQKPNFQD